MGNQFNVYRALFLKSASFQIRQVKSNIFQLILVGLLLGILIALTNAPFPKSQPSPPTFNFNNQTTFSTNGGCDTYFWTGCNYTFYNNFLFVDPNNVSAELLANGYFQSFSYVTGEYSNNYFAINATVPSWTKVSSAQYIIENYTDTQNDMNRNWYGPNYTLLQFQTPSAGIIFDTVTNQQIKFTLQLPGQYSSTAPRSILGYYGYDSTSIAMFVENWFINSFLSKFTGLNQTITTMAMEFADYSTYYNFPFTVIPNMIGIFFIPSTLIFIMPIFVYTIVHEKQERLVEMMKMMGISMHTYWISNYTFCFLVYLILALFVIIVGAIGRLGFFVDVNPMSYIILFVMYGLAQTSFAFFLSTFFNKAKASVIICYFVVMLISGIGSNVQMIAFGIGSAPWIFLALPGFALARGIYLISYTITGTYPESLTALSGYGYSPLAQVYVYLFVEAPVYLILAWYLDCVLPRENGVNYSPLFPIQAIISSVRETRRPKGTKEEKASILHAESDAQDTYAHAVDDVVQAIEFEDDDCLSERRRVHSNANFLVKIVDLHKKYAGRGGQPAKDALVKFCLALEQGECLGLLGPNGAGKTTLISILCGLSGPTSGTALVSGFDINTEMYKVHQILGFCPQHDILWADLTVEDHLLFYCRLKGYNKSTEREHVRKLAADVGLGGPHLTKKISELSGGMKRRLSIAIALVGDSKLVLLDEPTTGLDPDTRRSVWDIINTYKASRSIIITTHNIDEADVLCSKIAIMSLGSLKCIGSSQYLKNKFGAGYKLTAHLAADANADDYKAWVTSMFQQAELDPSAGTVDFIVPAGDMNVSQLFSVMKQNKAKFGILEWAINQMSLEEVFLKMVATDESQF